MKQPKTNQQEVLYTLISQGSVSILDFPYLSGFRTRVSELRKHIDFTSTSVKAVNKFGNRYDYMLHKLKNKEQAIEFYNKITEKN